MGRQGLGWWAPERQRSSQAPLSPKARLQRELPGDAIYSLRLNPTCSLRGVAAARSATLSRKGWPEPGSRQWGIKAITDLDVIQSKPPSSWTNLQLRGSYFKAPLGDTTLPFSEFIPAAKPGCAVPWGPACTFWLAELRLSQWSSKSCHCCKFSFIAFKKIYFRSLILLVRGSCSKILLCNPSGNHSSSSEEHRL